jgi:hypothetical protein
MPANAVAYRPGTVHSPESGYLMAIANGYCRTQLLAVAARLGVADHLAGGPRSAEELAAATDAKPEPLRRVLRGLTCMGVFAQEEDGRFSLTDLSQPMRTDFPGSVRSALVLFGEDNYAPVGQLLHAVRTGEVPFDHANGRPYHQWLDGDPERAETFAAAMSQISSLEVAEALAAYDFSGLGSVVEIGGGSGRWVAGVLRENPGLSGVLVDLAPQLAGAGAVLAAAGVAGRCTVVAADFFSEEPPSGHGAYVLKRVLHNWDDDTAAGILRGCRSAMGETGRLIVMERLLPDRAVPAPINEIAAMMDTVLLAKHTGRTRSTSEYGQLLARAGLAIADVRKTPAGFSILEARGL